MAMRMPPAAAQTAVLPTVDRTSLVFFAGLALIVLNFTVSSGPSAYQLFFHRGTQATAFPSLADTGLQVLMLGLLTLLAEYGGEGAGSFALVFIGALWLLWLVRHFGATPAAPHKGATGAGQK